MILSGADNRPPMLDKDMYDSWKNKMERYMRHKDHERMILELVEHGPLIWPTIEETRVTSSKKYDELSATEKIQADCVHKATNIILQGLPSDIYSLERECKMYDAFDKFAHIKGESLHCCQGEGHMARQCQKPKRKRDATWFRDKVFLAEAQGNDKVLNEEELEFLADTGVAKGPVTQTVISHNAAYQADDLNSYDYDCND
nr:hypothetical protein [Tanacetum cinerariifolium]